MEYFKIKSNHFNATESKIEPSLCVAVFIFVTPAPVSLLIDDIYSFNSTDERVHIRLINSSGKHEQTGQLTQD